MELSTIEEQDNAGRELIEKELGFKPPDVKGFLVVVQTYERPEDKYMKDKDGKLVLDKDGKPILSIVLPGNVVERDRWTSVVARVLKKGPLCYVGERFGGDWCKVGDWVLIRSYEGSKYTYRGIPMRNIEDKYIEAVIDDPTYVDM